MLTIQIAQIADSIAQFHSYINKSDFLKTLNIHQLANLLASCVRKEDEKTITEYARKTGLSNISLFSDYSIFSEHNLYNFPQLIPSAVSLLEKKSDCEYIESLYWI